MNIQKKDRNSHPLFNCGNPNCPLCSKAYSFMKLKPVSTKKEFSTKAVSPFIGRFNYPNINVGVLAPVFNEEDAYIYDAPRLWAEFEYSMPKIVDYRSSLLNSRNVSYVRDQSRIADISLEVALSSKPVDVEIKLTKEPKMNINFDEYSAPTGPSGEISNIKITSNPRVHTKVDKVYSDIDLKATDAITYLYSAGFDENFLSRILSVGAVGVKNSRKLVPTRWSITATDDIIGKKLIEEVRDFDYLSHTSFFGGYLGNYYLVLFFPLPFSYELFEIEVKNPKNYMTDYETNYGRKHYSQNCGGGYYSVRLAVLEKMKSLRRQGMTLVFRFITGDYTLPLGVWVTREASRKALAGKGIEFSSRELMIEYAKKISIKKFGIDLSYYLSKSVLIKTSSEQKRILDF